MDTSVIFWESEVDVGCQAPFQIQLSALPHVSLSSIPFTSLAVHFNADIPPITIRHVQEDSDAEIPAVHRIDLGETNISSTPPEAREIEAALRWRAGTTLVLTGTVSSELPMHISVSKIVLTIKERSWWIEVPIVPSTSSSSLDSLSAPKWLSSLSPVRFTAMRRADHAEVRVRYRPHHVHVAITHHGPAYLGEEFPIEIEVTNGDDRELEVVLDVLLQPTEIDEAGACFKCS